MAEQDDNRIGVTKGSFNGTPVALKVDHATGYLKIAVQTQELAPPTVSASVAPHDDNSVVAATGSFNGAIRTLKVTNANGYLRAVNNV